MIKLFLILLLSISIGITHAVPFSEIPTEPEVNFTVKAPETAYIQKDYCMKLSAFDDREKYNKRFNGIGKLVYADVEIEIFPSERYNVIEEITGKTQKNGSFSACDFITTHSYTTHGLYNMTVSVSYGESELIKVYQFWTIQK